MNPPRRRLLKHAAFAAPAEIDEWWRIIKATGIKAERA
jgi:hypothetical protein